MRRLCRALGAGSCPWSELAQGVPVAAVILSGGPSSVYGRVRPLYPRVCWRQGSPLLGICYGMQLLARYNAHIPPSALRNLCLLDEAGERTLEMAVRRMGFSARAHDRILKVARTIADLGRAERVSAKHLAEAVQYRSLDRNYWN